MNFDPAPVELRTKDAFNVRAIDFAGLSDPRSKGFSRKASLTCRIFLVAIASLLMMSQNTRAIDFTLADLLAGGELTSGDKRFFGFANYLQDGDLSIDASSINVFAISTIGPNGIEYGIRFQTPSAWELNGPNKNYDMSLDFLVQVNAPHWSISDNTLEFTGNHVGGGEAHLVEGVVDFQTNDTLANKEVYINIGNTGVDKLIDHQLFSRNSMLIKVSKDFQLQTRGGTNDNIFVSHFDQTFSQVQAPEPSTVILTAMGGLVLFGYRRMKRHDRKVESNSMQ